MYDCPQRRRQALGIVAFLGVLTVVLGCANKPRRAVAEKGASGLTSSPPAAEEAELKFLQQFIRRFPHDNQARLRAAHLYARQALFREAVDEVRAVLKSDPDNLVAYRALADIYFTVNFLDREIEALKSQIRIEPRPLTPYVRLVEIYNSLIWMDEAQEVVNQAKKWHPQSSEVGLLQALLYHNRVELDKAIAALKDALKHDPQNDRVYGHLSDCYRERQRFDEALETANTALRLRRSAAHYQRLGEIYLDQPDPAAPRAARDAFEKALALDPDNLILRYKLGVCYRKMGDVASARKEFEKVAASSLTVESVAFELGQIYLSEGETEKGKKLLAFHQKQQKRRARLKEAMTMLRVRKENNAAEHFQVARVYMDHGDLARAIVELKRVLQLNPHHAQARALLVRALERSGRTVEAQQTAKSG